MNVLGRIAPFLFFWNRAGFEPRRDPTPVSCLEDVPIASLRRQRLRSLAVAAATSTVAVAPSPEELESALAALERSRTDVSSAVPALLADPSRRKPLSKMAQAIAKNAAINPRLTSFPPTSTAVELLSGRKFLNQPMYACISRPQYKASCGISSLTAVFNYLFTRNGSLGDTAPVPHAVPQEQVLTVLGFHPPFHEIRFGPFTGNETLMRWFMQLCKHFGVNGRTRFLFKAHGKHRTIGMNGTRALAETLSVLKATDRALIYHCNNHYMVPTGFDISESAAERAYFVSDGAAPAEAALLDEETTWIFIGDSSKTSRPLHCVRWADIRKDIELQSPQFLNIRKLELGVQKRKTKKVGGNLHCLMLFCRVDDPSGSASTGGQAFEVDCNNFDGSDEEDEEEIDNVDAAS